jgi:thiamine-phosphate pyrophosphorylase
MILPHPPLLLVTDRRQARRPLAEIVASALGAGCRWISLREKDLPDDEQVPLARSLLPSVRRYGAVLTLHGEAALAKLAGIDGVHLSSGADPAAARALLGPTKLVGVSIHTVGDAEAINRSCVNYALAGPAFETASKPGYGPEIGRKGLADIARAARVPVLAIGGINAANLDQVLATGCAGIALISAILSASDPGKAAAELRAALDAAPHRPRRPFPASIEEVSRAFDRQPAAI